MGLLSTIGGASARAYGFTRSAIAAAVDAYFNRVTLLLSGDGTNGAQNNTFLDSSTNNFSITRNGNTTQGTFSPFSQTGWSNYFNGTGSGPYIRFGSSSALTFGTGDFTIEFWVYFISVNDGTISYLYDLRDANGTGSFFVQEPANTWTYRDGAGNLITTGMTSSTFTANQWYHVAVCRSSGVLYFFVNGTKVSSNPADTTNYATSYISIMSRHVSDGGNNNTNSYTSNFRVVKGTALYTSNFTPSTTPLTAVSGTSLLTCQANRFVDNSGNALTIAVDGSLSPSVQAFSPFAPAAAYDPTVVGGSGYFDGTGDYLSLADNAAFAFGSGDFTIECWAYTQAWASQYNVLICQWNVGTAFIFRITSSLVGLYVNIGGTQDKNVAVTNNLNTWNHFAVTRSGSTLTFYKNGSSIGTAAISGSINDPTDNLTVGILGDANATTAHTGYISGLRVIKGSAVAPTITAPPTAITNTSLLLNFTNAGIYDGTMKNNLETVGNAQVATSPVKYGSGSMYFNGSTSYLTRPYSPLFALGSGNFTVEAWVNTTQSAGGTTYPSIVGRWSGGASWDLRHSAADNSNKPTFAYNDGTSNFNVLSTGSTIYDGLWHHLAAVRNNNIITLYVDGINVGTATFTGTIAAATSTALTVGNSSGSAYYIGYIDDLRITIGVARYTANFTPPTAAFALQ